MRTILLMVLVAGCATRGIKDNQLYVVGTTESTILPPQITDTGRVICTHCCPDQRWGKCEEHREWWALGASVWEGVNVASVPCEPGIRPDVYCERVTKQWSGVLLICPKGHYIEREIEGPKP